MATEDGASGQPTASTAASAAAKPPVVKLEPPTASQTQHASQAGPAFPSGLRVLVVDDDPLCLKVVGQMLSRCNYEVTTSINGTSALEELRQHPNHYDLVLSDVYMPDMDGFKLLEHIGLELDLPVIMMSSNGETNVVLRGVTHGAVDFLIKPVRVEELRNVWQHVVRRRRESAMSKDGSDEHGEDAGKHSFDKKRKSSEERRKSTDEDEGEGGSAKKARVVWSVEMHQQFVNAVNTLGVDKAVPKRILDLMNVEGLTRENVASHLQKYRLYLKRVSGVAPANRGGKGPRSPGGVAGGGAPGAGGLAPGAPGAAASVTGQLPAGPAAGMPFAPPMGMQQAGMMPGGPSAPVPEHIMRLQMQTLQMQAMTLGSAANMPPGMPPVSGPLMQVGMPGIGPGGAMPPGFPNGMGMGPMVMPGMTEPMPDFGMGPTSGFPVDMSWAAMAPAAYPGADAMMGSGAAPAAMDSSTSAAPGSAVPQPAALPGADPAANVVPTPPAQPVHVSTSVAPGAGGPAPRQPSHHQPPSHTQPASFLEHPLNTVAAWPAQTFEQQQQALQMAGYGPPILQQSVPVGIPAHSSAPVGQNGDAGKDGSMDDILNFFLKDGDAPQ